MSIAPSHLWALITFPLSLLLYRCYVAMLSKPRKYWKNSSATTRSLAIFLGSGGHTSEALQLLSSLDFMRYTPRIYIVSEGDTLSAQKAAALEQSKSQQSSLGQEYFMITIPRARRVHQSPLSTPFSALHSLLVCVYHLTIKPILSFQNEARMLTDVLIMNGPGTCATLCIVVFLNRLLGLPSPQTIYVESFARVRSLSLSGRILLPLVDRFIVQWPQLVRDGGRTECFGCLV